MFWFIVIGVGGDSNDVIRVSEVLADVTKADVNLILWLLLEQSFNSNEAKGLNQAATDSPDASSARIQYDGQRGDSHRTVNRQAKRCRIFDFESFL